MQWKALEGVFLRQSLHLSGAAKRQTCGAFMPDHQLHNTKAPLPQVAYKVFVPSYSGLAALESHQGGASMLYRQCSGFRTSAGFID